MSGTVDSIKNFQLKDIGGKNTLKDLGIGAAVAAPFLLPELGTALGIGSAAASGTGLEAGSLDALAATGNLAGTLSSDAIPTALTAGSEAAGILPLGVSEASGIGITPDVFSGTLESFIGGTPGLAGTPEAGIFTSASGAGTGLDAIQSAAPLATGATPAGQGALAFSAPSGVAATGGAVDLTAASADAASPLDAALYPSGPVGAPTAAGTIGTTSGIDAGAAGAGGTSGIADASAATGGSAAGSSGFSLDKLITGAGDTLAKNALPLALAGGALAYDVSKANTASPAVAQVQKQAAQESKTGQQLSSYLTSGTLPPGLQQSVTDAIAAEKARIISNFAAQGMSTDPTKNSALAAELSQADQQGPVLIAQIGEQLLNAGISESGLSNALYSELAQIDQTQTNAVGQAIANMAAALSSSRTTVQIGGTTTKAA